jgi:D-glycero-D-manno-heptose 1,7-bisphosphate phosphatase
VTSDSHPTPTPAGQAARAHSVIQRRALFLDRDGTLIVHIPYLHAPEKVELIAGVKTALESARAAGFSLYLFTNQSGVGRGLFDLDAVHAVNRRMMQLLGGGDDYFAGTCIAPEAPDAPAVYRKPSPRYILETCKADGLDSRLCWMVGDSPSDWEAGLAAGVRVAAVGCTAGESHENLRLRERKGVPGYPDLAAVVRAILGAG